MNAINKLKLSLSAVLFSFLGIACSDIDDNLVNYPVVAEVNTVYYIDSESGNDANSGESESSAWKTFANINRVIFQAGNRILLKRGSVWTGQVSPRGAGTPSNPIILGAYGEGEKPIINGNGEAKAAVYLKNQSNWVIQDLQVSNYADVRGDIYRCGILVENDNGGTVSNIKILNNTVRDVSGSFRYVGAFHPHQYGGIAVNVIGQNATDKYDKVLIENNTVEKAGRTGIVVWDNLFASDLEASTNVVIRNNSVKDIDSDGIITYGCYGSLIEHNVANGCGSYREDGQFNGSAAIWCTRGKDCIIQYNEAYHTKALEGNDDGTGFDIDMDAVNCIVQYNYSHDNEGGFMLFVDASNSSGSIVCYNISQNDRKRVFMIAGGVTPNTQIYNNTIYLGAGATTKIIDHTWDDGGNINAPWLFKNNIIYNLGTGDYKIPGTGGVFEGNVYYGNHPANEPDETGKITVDPKFINVGAGGTGISTLDGYKLEENSPIMNTGVKVARNGGMDFFGNPVSSGGKPTPGAHELNGTASGESEMIDKLNDWSNAFYYSPNLNLDSSNPQFFGGDGSRAVRATTDDGIILYNLPNIKSVEVTMYLCVWYPTLTPQNIKIYGSYTGGDFANYIEIPVTYTTDSAVVEGWQKTTINTAGALPEGVNFIGVRINDPVNESWAVQIGEVAITYVE